MLEEINNHSIMKLWSLIALFAKHEASLSVSFISSSIKLASGSLVTCVNSWQTTFIPSTDSNTKSIWHSEHGSLSKWGTQAIWIRKQSWLKRIN